jgi:DNA mismatch endonuclease (patch repair protein)
MDTLTPEQRSQRMSLVRSTGSKAEMSVRRISHAMGYRFRLHRRDLPGTPDLVFPRLKAVIFVHGCFWHQHSCPAGNRIPKSRIDFWTKKLEGNVARDRRNLHELRRGGWRVLVVWECQVVSIEKLASRIRRFLSVQTG